MPSSSFGDFLSQEDHDALFNHWRSADRRQGHGSEEHTKWQAKYKQVSLPLAQAVENFLKAKSHAGELPLIPFVERRAHRMADAWNSFVQLEDEPESVNRILQSLARFINLEIATNGRILQGSPEDMAKESRQVIVGLMNEGAFEWDMIGGNEDDCHITGKALRLEIKRGWNPIMFAQDPNNEHMWTALSEDAPDPVVSSFKISAPSGRLIIGDWFRTKDDLFTNIVGEPDEVVLTGGPFERFSIARHCAEKFGFMSVNVGGSCPSLIESNGHLFVGKIDPSAKGSGKRLGTIVTDYHHASLIDVDVFKKVIAERAGVANAEVIAESFIASALKNKRIQVIQVEPGDLYFHFTAERGELMNFRSKGDVQVDFDNIDPMCVITRAPVDWVRQAPSISIKSRP